LTVAFVVEVVMFSTIVVLLSLTVVDVVVIDLSSTNQNFSIKASSVTWQSIVRQQARSK
jgi:hypothetical protein